LSKSRRGHSKDDFIEVEYTPLAMVSRVNGWTKEQIDEMISLYNQGISIRGIAQKMKRTVRAIEHRMARLPVALPPRKTRYTDAEVREIIRLIKQGYNIREVSTETGRPYYSILEKLKNLGLNKTLIKNGLV